MSHRNRLSMTILALATIAHLALQTAMADKVDDDIAGVLMSVSGYGSLRPITGGVVGEDVSRTLMPRILDENVAKTLRPRSPYDPEFKPKVTKRRGRRIAPNGDAYLIMRKGNGQIVHHLVAPN